MTPSFLAFFGVGDTEMLLIMVVVLIFFGGRKMPDFARGLGKALREIKKASGEVEREFKRVIDEAENPPPPTAVSAPPQAEPAGMDRSGEARADHARGEILSSRGPGRPRRPFPRFRRGRRNIYLRYLELSLPTARPQILNLAKMKTGPGFLRAPVRFSS